jgi:hypothetical protein
MGERTVSTEREGGPRGRRVGPFAIFGGVAVLAAVGALFEMLYYTTTPALSEATWGTVLGIVGALVGFFVWGLSAPAND